MVVCKRNLVSILILCTCIFNSRALVQTENVPPAEEIDNRLAHDCKHLLSASEEEKSGDHDDLSSSWGSNATTEDDFSMIDKRMFISEGDFSAERGLLNATGLPHRAFKFYVTSVSRTAYRGVYLVSATINLWSGPQILTYRVGNISERKTPNLEMTNNLKGLFSVHTGMFCSSFCAGKPTIDSKGSELDNQRHLYAPAEFVFRSTHPFSKNYITAFVKWDCDVHIQLWYPKVNTIETPIVVGVMNSSRTSTDVSFFPPIHIYGFSTGEYEYTPSVLHQAKSWGDKAKDDISPDNKLKAWYLYPPFCAAPKFSPTSSAAVWISSFTVVFDSTCDSTQGNHCSPFRNFAGRVQTPDNSPVTVQMYHLRCTGGPNWKISTNFNFRHRRSWVDAQDDHLTAPMLVAEGYWSTHNNGQLVMVAYYPASNGTILDSKIQITLQLPTIRTIHHRYGVVGHIRSTREANDALYFKPFSVLGEALLLNHLRYNRQPTLASMFQLEYRYDARVKARIDPMCSSYTSKDFGKYAKFPDGSSASDFALYSSVRASMLNSENSSQPISLDMRPFAIQDQIQDRWMRTRNPHKVDAVRSPQFPGRLHTEIPMSFTATLRYIRQKNDPAWNILRGLRAAEGMYNSETGHLCMLGCRKSPDSIAVSYYEVGQYVAENNSVASDRCDVFFSMQYPPTNPRLWAKRPFVTGNITSLLDATHPLYFNPLILNSTIRYAMYTEQAGWSVLRRNLETILSLGSLSLTALFAAIQVRYSSKQSSFKNLRYMSLVMLIILVSGHLFPLLLSFKSMWIRSRVSGSFYREKWTEAYEVIGRGTSMVALLLQLRLVQLVRTARSPSRQDLNSLDGGDQATSPKINTDTVVVQACLPLYVVVMAVVAIVHWYVASPLQQSRHYINDYSVWKMMWADIVAFSGVIIDLFLVPQVIANALWDTDGKVAPLHPVFYIGMTMVNSMAHMFDAGRAMKFIPEESSEYFYANPDWDLYSTTWDILIPSVSILLATLLCFQQKYGGRCFIPKRSTPRISYEQVPNLDL